MKAYKVESRYNDKQWVGKTKCGEYVALNGRGEARDVYQPDVVDDQNYLTCTGSYTPSVIEPLSKKDKAFLESAYIGQVEHCAECYDNAFDTEGDYGESGFKATQDGYVCADCFDAYAEAHLDDYTDTADECIPLKSAESLEDKGKLKFIERFIGGMVDGRGGRYADDRTRGVYIREGKPADILAKLRAENSGRSYVFSHDESGQFQTYFSVWQIAAKRGRFKKTG